MIFGICMLLLATFISTFHSAEHTVMSGCCTENVNKLLLMDLYLRVLGRSAVNWLFTIFQCKNPAA